MRDYGKIFTSFWTEFQGISDQGKILGAYLLSGPHTNMLGCFRLPFGYVQEDLKWSQETVSKAFDELYQNGFATHEKASEMVFIHKFLKWNEIENPNQGKAAVKTFDQLPEKCSLKTELFKAMVEYCPFLPDVFRNRFETVKEPFRNQEPEPEPEPDKKHSPSAAPSERGKRREKHENLGDYPAELLNAVSDWRMLLKNLRSPEIAESFPPTERFLPTGPGTNEATWKAWQKRKQARVKGHAVTDSDILGAVRMWALTKFNLAKGGEKLAAPMLPTLINSDGFVDALVRAVETRIAAEVVDVAS